MENFKKINLEQIVSIRTCIRYISTEYEYKEKPKFSFFFPREGWYYTNTIGSHKYKTIEEIESSGKLFVKDKRVYYHPHIEMRMSNQSLHTKYFKTEEDLKEYYDTHLASLNLIDL